MYCNGVQCLKLAYDANGQVMSMSEDSRGVE